MYDSLEVHQDERNLERSPGELVLRFSRINKVLEVAFDSLPMLLCVILDAVLHVDHDVHEAERLEGDVIRLDDADAFADSAKGILAVINDGVSDLLCELRIVHSGTASQSVIDPLLVRVGEGVQLLYGLCLLSLCRHLPG